MSAFSHAAVDPMSLILSDRAYLIWVELHNPHIPIISQVSEVVKSLTPEEKKFALAKAKSLVAYGKAIEESLAH